MLPIGEVEPAGYAVQLHRPELSPYVSELHKEHSIALLLPAYFPGLQETHEADEVAPIPQLALPQPQSIHAACPVKD